MRILKGAGMGFSSWIVDYFMGTTNISYKDVVELNKVLDEFLHKCVGETLHDKELKEKLLVLLQHFPNKLS